LDLEPLSVDRVELVTGDVPARSHVGKNGARIVGPLATICGTPVEGELAPWVCVEDESRRGSAIPAVDVAVHRAFDGVLALDLADGPWPSGWPPDWVALEELAIKGDVLDKPVSCDHGREQREQGEESGEGCRGCRPHIE